MRRVFSIIAWTTGAFFGTAIVAALAAAFATGVLTYLLVWIFGEFSGWDGAGGGGAFRVKAVGLG